MDCKVSQKHRKTLKWIKETHGYGQEILQRDWDTEN